MDSNSGKEYLGSIAEDVAEVEPRLVLFDENGRPDGMHYGQFTVINAKAIQDLKAENDELRARIEALEALLGSGS